MGESGTGLDSAFDEVIGPVDNAMVIVTTAGDGTRAGCLVGFHGQCSIVPRRYAVWLSRANHTYRVAVHAEHLAVHFLAKDDADLAALFGTSTGDDVDKFAQCDWTAGAHDLPLLDRCPRRLLLHRTGLMDEGSDHVCFTGEPVEVTGSGTFVPLRLSDVSDLDPGHEATDRPGDGRS